VIGPVTGEGKPGVNILPSAYGQENQAGKTMKLAKLSIAAKLYVIFTLLATVTVALAAVAILNANRHVALTRQFESAFVGAENVDRIDSLIYAVVMESRAFTCRRISRQRRNTQQVLIASTSRSAPSWRRGNSRCCRRTPKSLPNLPGG